MWHCAQMATNWRLSRTAKSGGGSAGTLRTPPPRRHSGPMPSRWPVAHFAIDARFPEDEHPRIRRARIGGMQQAGVAWSAIGLIVRANAHGMKQVWVSALGSRRIDDPPVVDPGTLPLVVLDREYVDLPVRQLRGIGLLPLRPDRIVNGIALPCPARAAGREIMPIFLDPHSRDDPTRVILELLLLCKISEDVFRP